MKVERWDKRHRYEVDSFGVMPVDPITRPRGAAVEPSQVELARRWIRVYCEPGLARVSSYALKHEVERWSKAELGTSAYVSNGAFIEAAIREGFAPLRQEDPLSLNVDFMVSVNPISNEAGIELPDGSGRRIRVRGGKLQVKLPGDTWRMGELIADAREGE